MMNPSRTKPQPKPSQTEPSQTEPLVLILGRPNVGKSTLFNRFTKRKRALVYDMPGVTRDHQFANVHWEGVRFQIGDTAGVDLDVESSLNDKIKRRLETDLNRCALVILLMDGKEGLTERDRAWCEWVRASDKPVVAVLNKMETSRGHRNLSDFYELGFDRLYSLSAETGAGTSELLDEIVQRLALAPSEAKGPAQRDFRLAIVGRPNVGKSTLFNYLLKEERVIVDDVPGTTRDPVNSLFYSREGIYWLTDTAGIRRKGRTEGGIERISISKTLQVLDDADAVIVLLDGVGGITKQDTHVCGEILKRYKPLILLVNKWDLAKKKFTQRQWMDQLSFRLEFMGSYDVQFISAKTGAGVDGLLKGIRKIRKSLQTTVTTSRFNEIIQGIVARHPLPTVRNRNIRILYGTPRKTIPISFILFCNEPDGVPDSYRRYFAHQLKTALGIPHLPIKLQWRRK